MSALFVSLFVVSSCVSLLAPVVLAMTLALVLLVQHQGASVDVLSVIVGGSLCAAIPAAAFLAVRFLRPLIDRGASRNSALELLAVVLAVTAALQDGGIAAAAAQVIVSGGSAKIAALSLILSRVVICAAVVALALSSICALSEGFVVWTARAVRMRYLPSQDALRQLLLLIAAAAGIDLILGLFSRELAPLSLLRGVLP